MAQMVKSLPAVWGTRVWSLGPEDALEKELVTYSRILAWKIPWLEEPGQLQSMESQSVGHEWVTSHSLSFYNLYGLFVTQTVKHLPTMWETRVQSLGQEDPLEKEMATHSSILAWKIPWMKDPGRLQSIGLQKVGHNWVTSLTHSIYIYI